MESSGERQHRDRARKTRHCARSKRYEKPGSKSHARRTLRTRPRLSIGDASRQANQPHRRYSSSNQHDPGQYLNISETPFGTGSYRGRTARRSEVRLADAARVSSRILLLECPGRVKISNAKASATAPLRQESCLPARRHRLLRQLRFPRLPQRESKAYEGCCTRFRQHRRHTP